MTKLTGFLKDPGTPRRSLIRQIAPGVRIVHEYYGEGTVTDISDDRITIDFGTRTKHFAWPDAAALMRLAEKP